MWLTKEPGKGARPGLRRSEANPTRQAPTAQTPPSRKARGNQRWGLRLSAPHSEGAPGLIRALPGGATPWPGKAPRPGTRFLPGAGARRPQAKRCKI